MVAYTNMGAAWGENRGFIVLVLSYMLAAELLSRAFGFVHAFDLYNTMWLLLSALTFTIFLLVSVLWAALRERPKHLLPFARQRIAGPWRLGERAILALPVILLAPLFFSSFSSVKSAIGLVHPYGIDPLLIEIEAALHGRQAWEILQPWLGVPIATATLNVIYNCWAVVVYAVIALVAVHPGGRLRHQYLVGFVLTWALLGSVAAMALSSVGPCFFGLMYPDLADPFTEQMAYLRSVNEVYPVWALATQDYLWSIRTGPPGLGGGISAAPSLHVAIAMLNAILGWKVSRLAGAAATVFLVLILLGSIHLGWHYALDGYISIIAVPLIWILSGWLVGAKDKPVTRPAHAE